MCMVPKGGRAEEDTMVAIFPLCHITELDMETQDPL